MPKATRSLIVPRGFPDAHHAADHGLVAIGGDYHPRTLLAAYAGGIFPWPSHELPFAWFSPNPRMILRPGDLEVSHSLRKTLRRGRFRVTWDTCFDGVIRACAAVPRPGQAGTWIHDELIRGFVALHRLGYAHSVETWHDDTLVGGLYGISLGTMFCGESMFFNERDASKVAFVHLVERLREWRFRFVDCQVYTEHLARFGAEEWHRNDFLDELAQALREPTRRGPWTDPGDGDPVEPD